MVCCSKKGEKMKIAFINPQRTVFRNDPVRVGTPLGLLSLAGMVRRYFPEIETTLIDASAEGKTKEEIKKNIFGINKKNVFRFGLTENELKARLEGIGIGKGDLVAISNIFTCEWENAALCARIAKNMGAIVVLGGHNATYTSEYMLEFTKTDYIILGEGEYPFVELIDSILKNHQKRKLKKIKGIAFKIEDKIINTGKGNIAKNLDMLEDMPFELLNPNLYSLNFNHWGKLLSKGNAFVDYSISRGCPIGCSFCTSSLMWGKKIRIFSNERVKNQLIAIKSSGFDVISIEDDQLLLLPENTRNFLFQELGNLNFNWVIDAGLYYPQITEQFIRQISENGCSGVFIPIEHPLLGLMHIHGKYDQLKKQENVKKKLENLFLMIGKYKLNFYVGMMVGFLEETAKTLGTVFEYAKLAKDFGALEVIFSFVKPLPGTRYGNSREIILGSEQRYWNLSSEFWTFSNPVLRPYSLTYDALEYKINEMSLKINGKLNSLAGKNLVK